MLAVLVGAAVSLHFGFHINRYSYKIYWRRENFRPFLGLEIPAALVTPRPLLVNAGIVAAGILAGILVHCSLRFILPRIGQRQPRRSVG